MINPQLKKAIPANSEGGIALRKNWVQKSMFAMGITIERVY